MWKAAIGKRKGSDNSRVVGLNDSLVLVPLGSRFGDSELHLARDVREMRSFQG